jgi:hypothetical protein
MNTNTGPNTDSNEPEVSHPDTEEPPPPDAEQEAAGGGGGAYEPPKSFDDILRQMREVAGIGETARPMTDGERPSSEEEEEPKPEAVPIVPVAEYIPHGASFDSGPFDIENLLFDEQVKKAKSSARHHGFMIGMGLGSAMSAMGAAALAREFIWQVTDLTTDMGSVVNSIFGKPRWAMPKVASRPGPYRQARGRSPAMKYGAPFPGEPDGVEASGYYEEADDAPQGASSGVELPDFETFMRKVVGLKAKVDTGAIEIHPEIREIFDQLNVIIQELVPHMTGAVADDPAEDPSK